MASPFAIYFYSVYRPALSFLDQFPQIAWSVRFFLPHIVEETSSTLINLHNTVGFLLAVGGFAAFCWGAAQVYYHKLAKKGAVTGGVYNIIRHPQYAAFILCSFGLLLLWPRYIILITFITMLFVYYFLARIEEKECEEKFGQSYIDYKNKTNMFLPFKIPLAGKLPGLPQSRLGQIVVIAAVYVTTILVAVGLARGLQSLALDSIYSIYEQDAAYISIIEIEPNTMERLVAIALANEEVQTRLAHAHDGSNTKYLNYILPSEWSISEIPMNPVAGGSSDHFLVDGSYDENSYKIIFTRADLRTDQDVAGKEILLHTTKPMPIVEVWVDLAQAEVVDIKNPPMTVNYENVPVPVY
jgi:protein-S-isoprenylcysteine O-methyltransferase Ste14